MTGASECGMLCQERCRQGIGRPRDLVGEIMGCPRQGLVRAYTVCGSVRSRSIMPRVGGGDGTWRSAISDATCVGSRGEGSCCYSRCTSLIVHAATRGIELRLPSPRSASGLWTMAHDGLDRIRCTEQVRSRYLQRLGILLSMRRIVAVVESKCCAHTVFTRHR